MKKALLVALTLGLICAWAAPAMAVDWTAIGGFTVKNALYKNIDYRMPYGLGGVPGSDRLIGLTPATNSAKILRSSLGAADPAWNETNWWMQMRGDIFIIARASADLYGVFGIEVNSYRFGDVDNPSIPYIGTGGVAATTAGRWNADAVGIAVKSMFIDFKVPSLPVWFRAGIQPYMLRPTVFLYVDAAGITSRIKIDADPVLININPFWAKMYSGSSGYGIVSTSASYYTDYTTADDGNFFGVDINAVVGTIKPGVFFAMQRWNEYYIYAPAGPDFGRGDMQYWWVGPYVDATIGPVAITADFIYSGGEDKWTQGTVVMSDTGSPNNTTLQATYSRKHSGFVTRGQVSYTMGKFVFGVGALYGTGDNPGTRNKFEGWQIPYKSEAAKFNEDFLVLTGDFGLRQPYGTMNTGGLFKPWSSIGQGVWYVRGFADYAVTDWLKLKFNAGYIGDTVHNGDEFGTDGVVSALGIAGQDLGGTGIGDDNSIGWELDTAVQINIYKNLYLDTAFGYLIAGKALAGQYNGWRAQDPWSLMTVLTYQF